MLKLFHTTNIFTSKTYGVRKVVYNKDEYIDNDTILFIDKNIEIQKNITLLLTTSKELYLRYKDTKEILFFPSLSEMEEYAIVKININTIYFVFRPSANTHTLFLTNKCNHYCIMCSEPPRTENDDYLIQDNFRIIELLDNSLSVIVITGGEPTLLGDSFLKIIKKIRIELPDTIIRVLTNGRAYQNESFVRDLANIAKDYYISEIPVYSSNFAMHDYIVQSKNAFFETIEGFYMCAKYGLSTEVRVVITKQNYQTLSDLIYFIYRNIPFIDHIALMGLEYIGFALNNFEDIHISPLDYNKEVYNAIKLCKNYLLPISIYNIPLCLVHEDVREYAKQSISDWKNEFSKICDNCDKKTSCSGMFSSTQKYYEELLNPIKAI